MLKIIKRFREPSSWAALGVLVGVFAPEALPAVDGVAQIVAGLAAVAGVVLQERGAPVDPNQEAK